LRILVNQMDETIKEGGIALRNYIGTPKGLQFRASNNSIS
jgi:hypothetical protein